jgi:hypothetical protein
MTRGLPWPTCLWVTKVVVIVPCSGFSFKYVLGDGGEFHPWCSKLNVERPLPPFWSFAEAASQRCRKATRVKEFDPAFWVHSSSGIKREKQAYQDAAIGK